MFTNRDFKHVYFGDSHLSGRKIPYAETYKYLGHIISAVQRDKSDISRQIKYILYVQGNVIARKFYMCTENVKIKLFTTYCICLYTARLWSN